MEADEAITVSEPHRIAQVSFPTGPIRPSWLFKQVDAALYQAKEAGRNRVIQAVVS